MKYIGFEPSIQFPPGARTLCSNLVIWIDKIALESTITFELVFTITENINPRVKIAKSMKISNILAIDLLLKLRIDYRCKMILVNDTYINSINLF